MGIVMDRRDFDGMDKTELLIAIEEVMPGLSFPEAASREDLILSRSNNTDGPRRGWG
jgi:hypothetical protein